MLDLPKATNGLFVVSASPPYPSGTRAELKCSDGYAPSKGSVSTLVMVNGRLAWEPSAADCEPVLSDLPGVKNGRYLTKEAPPYKRGTVALLQCDPGYGISSVAQSYLKMSPSSRLYWDPAFLSCIPNSCSAPPPAPNARIVGNQYTFPNFVEYQCSEGFRINHRISKFFCSARGLWDPPIPSSLACVPIECPELDNPQNGVVRVRGERRPGDVAKYTCFQGFELIGGTSKRLCQADGSWEGGDRRCDVPPKCKKEPDMLDLISRQDAESVTLKCESGDVEVVKCLESGQWSPPAPWCQKKKKPKEFGFWIFFAFFVLLFLGFHVSWWAVGTRQVPQG